MGAEKQNFRYTVCLSPDQSGEILSQKCFTLLVMIYPTFLRFSLCSFLLFG
jgi:hypothetical protein